MAPQFDEQVRCTQGLLVTRPGPTNHPGTWIGGFDGIELIIVNDQRARLLLGPNGLFFHHPAGHDPVVIDGVNGDIILANADCAEDFDAAHDELIDPGTVVVINDERSIRPCDQAYDKRVAGVVSGAGGYKPGLVLDRRKSDRTRVAVALMGKVFCKVDARFGAIQVGDLLTPSSTIGHAMKATDPLKAFGAVIGKALRPLEEGQGLLPILIALQ
jgi:hypothetical protein